MNAGRKENHIGLSNVQWIVALQSMEGTMNTRIKRWRSVALCAHLMHACTVRGACECMICLTVSRRRGD